MSHLAGALAYRGEIARAKAEFEIALSQSPNSFEILTFYSGWAVTFGSPEKGRELADRAISLNPNHPAWAAGIFAWAYFLAGCHEAVLRMLERRTRDNFSTHRWIMLSASYRAIRRATDARAATNEALKRFPNLTIEEIINEGGLSGFKRRQIIDAMRAAGFPACASADDIAKLNNVVRLDEYRS